MHFEGGVLVGDQGRFVHNNKVVKWPNRELSRLLCDELPTPSLKIARQKLGKENEEILNFGIRSLIFVGPGWILVVPKAWQHLSTMWDLYLKEGMTAEEGMTAIRNFNERMQ